MMLFPVRRGFWMVLALTVSIFLIYSAVGERGFVSLNRLLDQRDELRTRVRNLRESNEKIAEEIGLLRDDPVTIENLARTELGMVRDGETVFILSDRPGEPSQ
jgi:cell division protein FtsB